MMYERRRQKMDLREVDFSRIPSERRMEYTRLLQRNADVFAQRELDVGKADVIPQVITLKDVNKISVTPQYRSVSYTHLTLPTNREV